MVESLFLQEQFEVIYLFLKVSDEGIPVRKVFEVILKRQESIFFFIIIIIFFLPCSSIFLYFFENERVF